ncbi:class I SAM-dependent methyltransferase [Nocardia sp. NPDC005978]|uniref:class I SAM-dependent methyltransferase n=1 Tax=unclassified Nocardia TaxID=2637762 RepID=UPI00339FE103
MLENRSDGADSATVVEVPPTGYEAVFDGGHRFRLLDRPGTFRLSRAGLALGNHLRANLRPAEIGGRILEVGTGSGAIALLLRDMGATSIAATDICAAAVESARQHEVANFGDSIIDFEHCDLFPRNDSGENERFDLIVFNPPGWRTPPGLAESGLAELDGTLNLDAMFYGDSVVLRFLQQLPDHLTENGRAVIGLNSLIGIADIADRAASAHRARTGSAIHSRVLESCEFPLMFYTEEWARVREFLLTEFERGRREYAATYVTKGDTIHWFYEITEVTVEPLALSTAAPRHEPPVG